MSKIDYSVPVTTLGGAPTTLEAYRGKTVLVVNTASKCGFTPQYAGLEALWKELGPERFAILGFPCDQFGHQEPGSEEEIGAFCTKNYGVTFPMFAKVEVNGAGAHPLFQQLKAAAPGVLGTESIKWNFTKFLVGPDGEVIKRYASTDTPESLAGELRGRVQG